MNFNFRDQVKKFMFLENRNFKAQYHEDSYRELRREEYIAEAYNRG